MKILKDKNSTQCGKPTPNGPCILPKNHATPRAVNAPMTIESYGDGSAVENFGCVGAGK